MSFLVDPPWLAANGYLIAKVAPNNETVQRALELAVDATFFAVSIPLYLNADWTEPVWKPTGFVAPVMVSPRLNAGVAPAIKLPSPQGEINPPDADASINTALFE